MEYARRIPRFFAWLIDVIIVLIIIGVLNAIGVIDTVSREEGAAVSTVDFIIQAAIPLSYFVVLTTAFGATLGKKALGMRVVGADGNKAGVGAVLIREIIVRSSGAILAIFLGQETGASIGLLVGLIVVFVILIDDKRQGLHDKVAKTFVVRA